MKAQIIKIGNSQGVRIPKALIRQSGLSKEVELVVEGDAIIIRPSRVPRSGWDESFMVMARLQDDELVDNETLSGHSFDDAEWEWK